MMSHLTFQVPNLFTPIKTLKNFNRYISYEYCVSLH